MGILGRRDVRRLLGCCYKDPQKKGRQGHIRWRQGRAQGHARKVGEVGYGRWQGPWPCARAGVTQACAVGLALALSLGPLNLRAAVRSRVRSALRPVPRLDCAAAYSLEK